MISVRAGLSKKWITTSLKSEVAMKLFFLILAIFLAGCSQQPALQTYDFCDGYAVVSRRVYSELKADRPEQQVRERLAKDGFSEQLQSQMISNAKYSLENQKTSEEHYAYELGYCTAMIYEEKQNNSKEPVPPPIQKFDT